MATRENERPGSGRVTHPTSTEPIQTRSGPAVGKAEPNQLRSPPDKSQQQRQREGNQKGKGK